MTTTPDLPVGTRCMVDVAAMERDGPELTRCGCAEEPDEIIWRQALKTLAEQTVVVSARRATNLACCKTPYVLESDEVSLDCYTGLLGITGFLLRRKYLVPLPDGEDEREVQ